MTATKDRHVKYGGSLAPIAVPAISPLGRISDRFGSRLTKKLKHFSAGIHDRAVHIGIGENSAIQTGTGEIRLA